MQKCFRKVFTSAFKTKFKLISKTKKFVSLGAGEGVVSL